MKQDYSLLDKQLSFLVLDYNRPAESAHCLRSIKQMVTFDNYEVVYFSNGGDQDYVYKFYKEGLIDRCILNTTNEGTGFGTMKLMQSCCTDYFMSIQCDNFISRELDQEELDRWIEKLEGPGNINCIDLAHVGPHTFSERCYVMKTDFYNSNPYNIGGGPGPYSKIKWTERSTQDWLGCDAEGQSDQIISWAHPTTGKPLIGNLGKYTITSCKHGGEYKFRNDTQQLWVLKPPTEKSFFGKEVTDEEWDKILNGEWEEGAVPENQRKWISNYFGQTSVRNEKGGWDW